MGKAATIAVLLGVDSAQARRKNVQESSSQGKVSMEGKYVRYVRCKRLEAGRLDSWPWSVAWPAGWNWAGLGLVGGVGGEVTHGSCELHRIGGWQWKLPQAHSCPESRCSWAVFGCCSGHARPQICGMTVAGPMAATLAGWFWGEGQAPGRLAAS
jgi:hypothetical protein